MAGFVAGVNTSGSSAIGKQSEQEVGYDCKTSRPGPVRPLRGKGTFMQV